MKVAYFLVAASIACGNAYASQETIAFSPEAKFEGLSAADLSANWWQWAMAAPDESNPVRDTSGIYCNVGQKGKIWFLAGGFGSSKIKRSCEIPAGKHIFFPVINMVYWPQEGNNGYTCEDAKASATLNNDTALDLFVELNGEPISNPKRYRAKTDKCFDVFARVQKPHQAYRAYPSASDGYWVLLRPLPKGKHTLKFGGRYNNPGSPYGRMLQDIEYELVVK